MSTVTQEREAGSEPQPVHLEREEAAQLGGQIIAGAARVASVTAAWIEMVGVYDAGCGHYYSDFESAARWLEWACSMGRGTAREHVRVARSLRRMPVIAAAFGRGELSYSKVRECTRLVGIFDEETLLKRARDLTAAQLERAVRGFRAGRTARLMAEAERRVTHRELPDGSVQITAILAPEEAAVVLAAMDTATGRYRAEAQEAKARQQDVPAGTSVPGQADEPADIRGEDWAPSYSRADALIDVARGYLASGPADVSGEDRDVVVVHVTEQALHTDVHPECADTGEERDELASAASIEGVGEVSVSSASRIACTGIIQPIVLSAQGEVLGLGREQRLATKKQRRALMARDRHCQFPGCLRAVRLHAHHIVPWALGGLTDVEAMILLCRHHHVVVHAASITIKKNRAGHGFRFTRVGGEVITAQRPDEFSGPDRPGTDTRPVAEEDLLRELADEARAGEPFFMIDVAAPERGRRDESLTGADYQLPDPMADFADMEDRYDPRASVFPRWAGERMTQSAYWELMEHRPLTPRTNPWAPY